MDTIYECRDFANIIRIWQLFFSRKEVIIFEDDWLDPLEYSKSFPSPIKRMDMLESYFVETLSWMMDHAFIYEFKRCNGVKDVFLRDLKEGLGVKKVILEKLQSLFGKIWESLSEELQRRFRSSLRRDRELGFGWDTWATSCKKEAYLGLMHFFIPDFDFASDEVQF